MSFRSDVKISYIHDNSEERLAAKKADQISQCLLYFVVLLCFYIATEDVFVSLFKNVCNESVSTNIFSILFLLLPMIPLMKFAGDIEERKHILIGKTAVAITYVVATWLFLLSQISTFLDGFGHIRWCVCAAINNYYKLNISVDKGSITDCDFALSVSLFLVFAITLYFALLIETRVLLIVVPTLVYSMAMCVGYAPSAKSAFYMTAGVLLACSTSWERYQSASGRGKPRRKLKNLVITLALAFTLPFFNNSLFMGNAERMVNDMSPKIKKFQSAIDEKIRDKYEKKIQDLTEQYEGQDKETITNRKPIYNEEQMFTVSLNKRPSDNLYFREFYGMKYESGAWWSQFHLLENHETHVGYWKGYYTDWLKGAISKKAKSTVNSNLYTHGTMSFEKKTKSVYIPHIYEIDDDSQINYTGEYVASRNKSDDDIPFSGYDISLYTILKNTNLSYRYYDDNLYEDYGEYVGRNYMSGCKRVPSAKLIADKIRPYVSTGVSGYGEAYSDNVYRIYCAILVAEYLSSAEYSMDLKGATDGNDNIEYFLADSKTGYCVHFASAGTLILQYMGVPARYASGYVVMPSDFSVQGSAYCANVLDSDAHAWTEIYLENIGWVPVEMTTGYGNRNNMTVNDSFVTIANDPMLNPDLTTEVNVTEENPTTERPATVTTETAYATTEKRPDDSSSEQTTTGESEEVTEEKAISENDKGNKFYIIIMALMLFVGIAACVIVKSDTYSEKKIRKILDTDVKKALFKVNEAFIKKIRKKKHIIKKYPSDMEYIGFMTDYIPKEKQGFIDRYVKIMQRAKFSNHEISVEEVEFCMTLCYTNWKKYARDNDSQK